MKIVAGFRYLRGVSGEVVPYSEQLAKASGYEPFVAEHDFDNGMQLPENEKLIPRKSAAAIAAAKEELKAQPVRPQPVKKFDHMDIRQDMKSDLSVLD